MRISALTTGTLQLKPTFLDGSPAHGGSLGLIGSLWRDSRFTASTPSWDRPTTRATRPWAS